RHLARPEARHPDLPGHLAVGLLEVLLEFLERNFDGQLDPGRAELFDVGLHLGVAPGDGHWHEPAGSRRTCAPAQAACCPILLPAKSRAGGTTGARSPATGDDHGNSAAAR